MLRLIVVLMIFFQLACDSPVRNKVRGDLLTQSKELSFKMKLKKDELKLFVYWLQGPFNSTTRLSVVVVNIFKDGELFSLPSNIELLFDASMPSMGHGIDNQGFFKEITRGVYRNDSLTFQMSGLWLMKLLLLDYEQHEEADLEEVEWEQLL